MNNVMDRITPLNSCGKSEFTHPAHRIMAAHENLQQTYHKHPVRQDILPDHDAVAGWSIVTCAYSGIEQAMKCLLKMRDAFIDKSLCKACLRRLQDKGCEKCKNPAKCGYEKSYELLFKAQIDFVHSLDGGRNHKHHDIGKLFRALTPEEQDVLRVSFAIYRSLHDYIPLDTVDSFLDAIDSGYPTWRYFLLEGKMPPTTHPGAMLEIWSALKDILLARVFTNHGLYSAEMRIKVGLNRKLRRDPYEHVDLNECIDFFLQFAERKLDSDISSNPNKNELSTLVDDITKFVRDDVKEEWIDNDLVYLIYRSQMGEIEWNTDTNLFEKVSRLEKVSIRLIASENSHVESFLLDPSVEAEKIESVPDYIEEFTFRPRPEGDHADADWTTEVEVERELAGYRERMAEIEEYEGGDECEAYTCNIKGLRLIIVLYDSKKWFVYEYLNGNVPGDPPHFKHITGNVHSLRQAIREIEHWRETENEEILDMHKHEWRRRGRRKTEDRGL